MRRLSVLFLVIALLFSSVVHSYACDEKQTESCVAQVLFGNQASKYASDENLRMLLNALFLCSAQHDNSGQDKLTQLKNKKVGMLPTLSDINIAGNSLLDYSHNIWKEENSGDSKVQANRKKVLQRTVDKVFGFDGLNRFFNADSGKSDSFSAFLYYMHILSDYLADDPDATTITQSGKTIPSFSGQPYFELNNNMPSFSVYLKKSIKTFSQYSSLDALGRCGFAIANISIDNMAPSGSRQYIGSIKPSGWVTVKHPGFVNSEPAYLYNRCHLISHQLNNNDGAENLITGTRYLNESGMKPFEDRVASYIISTGNHVLYRATPVFVGSNLVASGVQLEAYSIEDDGKGICFNVYCYNVQPGISINYVAGSNEVSDDIYYTENTIPFAVSNPSDSKPDLIYEVNKHFEVLFYDQNESNKNYLFMMSQISELASLTRTVGTRGENEAQRYIKLKECEYKYFDILKTYIPMLLKSEKFFSSLFK